MNRQVQIYIEGQRLELFNDEKITINSSVQNISDISKTYTDFSQSFTVPASVNNNKIFQHFYSNEVDSTLDYNLRRTAFIEIDLIPFRTGKIQLEKAQLKNGNVDNYVITFYGDLVTLKDLFGEDKLNSLDCSSSSHLYTGANVQTRISSDSVDYDLRWPLISSSRVWQYNSGTPSQDIDHTSGHIHYNELFPALRIPKIFDAIESKYSIDFTGSFLTNKRFKDAFLYLKNKDTFEFFTDKQNINLDTITLEESTNVAGVPIFNVSSNTINLFYSADALNAGATDEGIWQINTSITTASTTTPYFIEVWDNGILVSTTEGVGTDFYQLYYVPNSTGLNKTLQLRIKAEAAISFTSETNVYHLFTVGTTPLTNTNTCEGNSQTLVGNVDISSNMPDMKISDFFSGVLNQFNLTCVPTNASSYSILPLEDWYSAGSIRNITEYTDRTETSIDRLPLYKKISFEHEKSESFMNRKFFDLYAREYGDLNNTYVYDGSDYTIKLPYENLEFNKFTGSNIQVGYCLTKAPDYKPYIPKPILIYKYDKLSCSFHFNDGTSTNHVLNYIPFGQDLLVGSVKYSLNFGADQSTLLNENIANSIVNVYYFDYLSNLYNNKARLVTIKTNLPTSILSNIKLNDRLIIRDKRYIINTMQIDLTSGDVTFQLISDFRNLSSYIPK
jgi:hypothetical protein